MTSGELVCNVRLNCEYFSFDRDLLTKSLRTLEVHLRGAVQCFLLRAVLNLADKVSAAYSCLLMVWYLPAILWVFMKYRWIFEQFFDIFSVFWIQKKYQKITRISPEYHRNNCIILQLFDFRSSYNACYRQLTGVKRDFSKCMYVLGSSSMMNANVTIANVNNSEQW